MITYQELYDILRKEKYNEVLQQLPKNFLEEISEYLKEKKELLGNDEGKGLFSETVRMTRKQLDNAMTMIKDIMSIRQRKVLNLAFTAVLTGVSKRDTENLMENEKDLFEMAVKQLERSQQAINEKLEGKSKGDKLKSTTLLVRFKEDLPSFIDAEGNSLGPFKQEDLVNLSKETASILVASGKAIPVDESEKI